MPRTGQLARVQPSWSLVWVAALPMVVCMLIMGMLAFSPRGAIYRTLYLAACLVWFPVLAALQWRVWRRNWSAWRWIGLILVVTYAMSVVNNVLGIAMSQALAWQPERRWSRLSLFGGLDDCWWALLAFCALHALVVHTIALQREQSRLRDMELVAREAELRALRQQLQPHFLFNALNGISTLVADRRHEAALRMIADLASLLRTTLDAPAHEVPLAEEIALTQTYLAIEQARLGERLKVQWDIGPDVLAARVPFLLLQPLAENAIRHGIARRHEPGVLSIRATREGERLHLRVENEGVVDAPDVATAPPAAPVGQANLVSRLKQLYHDAYAFQARRLGMSDYRVEITIPFTGFKEQDAGA